MPAVAADPLQTLKMTQTFAAPRERVFRAWTDPGELKKWWGPGGFKTPSAEIDLRVGGRYRIAMQRPDGGIHHLFGTYVEVKPPERLAMTWSFEGTGDHDGFESLVTVEFKAKGNETEIVLTHEKLPVHAVSAHDVGWKATLVHLADYLAT